MHSVSVGLAIELPAGSTWDKRKAAGGWTASTEQRAWPSKTSSFIHCFAMCNENFAATLLRIGHRNWAAVAKASSGVP
jgi:hypothetical protein